MLREEGGAGLPRRHGHSIQAQRKVPLHCPKTGPQRPGSPGLGGQWAQGPGATSDTLGLGQPCTPSLTSSCRTRLPSSCPGQRGSLPWGSQKTPPWPRRALQGFHPIPGGKRPDLGCVQEEERKPPERG